MYKSLTINCVRCSAKMCNRSIGPVGAGHDDRRALRRGGASKTKEDLLVCGPLSLSVPRHEVRWDGSEIDLTSREFSLLQTLLENKNVVLSRDSLLEKVWGYDYMGETNVVDVYVRYLRNKIAAAGGENVIQTVRGVGYVIRDEHE